jgi:hypothetical protein
MSNPLLVGIDVHRTINAVCVMDGQGQEVAPRFTVHNNRPGTHDFVHRMAQLMLDGGCDALHIAAEATGWYWFHLFLSLSQDPVLNQWPLVLYPVNPRLTATFKKTSVDLDHTDLIDVFVVADRLRLGRDLPAPFHYDDTYGPLRFLTRYRYHLVHTLAREKAYCLALLYLKASEYTRQDLQPFSNVFGAASRAVLKEFAPIEEIAGVPRFHFDQAKVAKFAGFKWRKHQSANFQAEETRLTRTGNRYLRYYFCEAANAVRMRDADYAAYYDRKYHKVRKHQHKRVFSIDDAVGILFLELISQIRRVWRWLVNVSIAMIYVAPTVGQIGARRMGMPMAFRLSNDCLHRFSPEAKRENSTEHVKQRAVKMYCEGMGISSIG